MKRKISIIAGTIILSFTLTAGLMDPNGKAGYTGSPGEATCNTTGCHSSFILNSSDGSVTATSDINNWVYEPLTKYTITIKVAKPVIHLFGFGAEILTAANANAGTILVSDTPHTQIKSRVVNGIIRRNIVHKQNGGAFQDSAIFTFNWTSPDTTAGNVTLYFAGNAANANGNEAGDYIYSSSQLITPSGGNKVESFISSDQFSVYPNPVNSHFSLHYYLPKNENVVVRLYDLKSSLSYILANTSRPAGENNELMYIPSDCKSGLYLLSVESNTSRITRKLLIN